MTRRHWTIMLVPNDGAGIRQVPVSRQSLRFAVSVAVAVLVCLSTLAAGFFVKESQRLRADRLDRENRLLAAELEAIRGQLDLLGGALAELSERDDHVRLLASLNPIDEDVQQVGIGGPGTPTLEGNPLWRENRQLGEVAFATAYDLNGLLRRARLLASSWEEATTALEDREARLLAMPSIWPTEGYVSSRFSTRRWHPILNVRRPHEGIDISAPPGTPVVATGEGRVVFVGRNGGYGQMVEVDHGYGYVTRYAHLRRITVERGQAVDRGDKVGEVGSTGLALGPHLHYEVLVNGRAVNPDEFIFDWDVIRD